MCGIAGYFSTDKSSLNMMNKRKALIDMIRVNSLRGSHSTGFFGIKNNDNSISYFKAPIPGWDFTEFKYVDKELTNLLNFKTFIIHNRHATIGGVSKKTAHPFDFENIIGVHNGTLTNHRTLHKDLWDVDSMALYASMNEIGVKETLEKTIGAVSIVYYDKIKERLGIYHNDERELSYAKLAKEDTYFIASEIKMLEWILSRNDLDIEEIKEVPVDTLMEFDISDLTKFSSIKTKTKCEVPYYGNNNYSLPISNVKDNLSFLEETFGVRIGDKVLVEIDELKSLNSDISFRGFGTLIKSPEFPDVIVQGIKKEEARAIYTYLKEKTNHSTVLVYARVLSYMKYNNVHVKIMASPAKPLTAYLKEQLQKDYYNKYMKELQKATAEEQETNDYCEDMVEGPSGVLIPKSEWEKLTKNPCPICGFKLTPTDNIDWHSFSDPCHEECHESFIQSYH